MLFEDLHWIDPTSLELLTAIVDRVQRLPVLLLVTTRPEFTPPWPSHAHVTALPLTRLSRRECVALVDRIADGKVLPDEVLEQILARTDGVPLFIEELTKTVIESGMLIDMGDRYTIAGPLPSLAIPTTLHDSLTARLDRLAPVKEVAQIAACIGRDFDYDLLAAASSMPEEGLRSGLEALRHAELIIARELSAERYSFKHALVRDAAYAGLLKSRRVQLHAAIARAIEQSFAHLAEAEPGTLAFISPRRGCSTRQRVIGCALAKSPSRAMPILKRSPICAAASRLSAASLTAQARTGSSSTSSSRWDPVCSPPRVRAPPPLRQPSRALASFASGSVARRSIPTSYSGPQSCMRSGASCRKHWTDARPRSVAPKRPAIGQPRSAQCAQPDRC